MRQQFTSFDWFCFFRGMILAMIGGYTFTDAVARFFADTTPGAVLIGYAFIASFFLFFGISNIFRSILIRPLLELNEKGFMLKVGRRVQRHGWHECSPFFVAQARGPFLLGKVSRAGCDLWKPTDRQNKSKISFGAHCVLTPQLGVGILILVDILNDYRERFAVSSLED